MAENLDYRGLRCPQPVLKLSLKAPAIASGASVSVLADCPEFEKEIQEWCTKAGKVLVSIVDKGGYKEATIQF